MVDAGIACVCVEADVARCGRKIVKIGIITIQKCDNFGADLQAYALGAKLRKMGYDAENVDYLYYKNPRHIVGRKGGPVFKQSVINRLKEALYPAVRWARTLKSMDNHAARKERFAVWQQNIKCGREYRDVDELYEVPPKYDVYMVGSDQVWNPRMGSNNRPYFLDFAPQNAKCVSYAASFGVSALPGIVYYHYRKWLKRFTFIGLRESSGVDIVKTMALNADIQHVADPTMLLTAKEWGEVATRPMDDAGLLNGYVLIYDLLRCENTVEVARRIARTRSLKVVSIDNGPYGPGEFLWLFAHASVVVTNSFHGTVFSILNHRPFMVVVPPRMTNLARIDSLLVKLGLHYDCSNGIDWNEVDKRLAVFRDESISFLEKSIVDVPVAKVHRLPRGCYGFICGDDKLRAASTSGGAFSRLASAVLEDGGVVFGAVFVDGYHRVEHMAADSVEGLERIRQSKYVWSDPSAAYKKVCGLVRSGRKVLFSGTPCQCAAMRKLTGENDNLVTVDFVCHGTPNAEYFESYAKELESHYGSKLVSYSFRDKRSGWNFPHVVAQFENGKTYDSVVDPYFIGFAGNMTLREACYRCPYAGLERRADITIGDCWRIGASMPEMDDNRGVSLVLVNTLRGDCLFKRVREIGADTCFDYDLDLAQMRNMPLMQHAIASSARESFQREFGRTKSYARSSKVFITRTIMARKLLTYFVKKLGWFYFKRHQ